MKNEVRQAVAHLLSTNDWTRQIDEKHQTILRTVHKLRKQNNIYICKADKGNMTVIMDTEDYKKKISDMLTKFPYRKFSQDPTPNYEKTIKTTLKHLLHMNKITKELFHYLDSFSSKCPRFYGAPKLHKPNIPLRPIVDFRNSPSYNLASYLNKIFHPFTEKGEYIAKNSLDFVNKCRAIEEKRGYCLVSFDVKSLFTKVPIQHTLSVMKSRLTEDTSWQIHTKLELQDLLMLTEICM